MTRANPLNTWGIIHALCTRNNWWCRDETFTIKFPPSGRSASTEEEIIENRTIWCNDFNLACCHTHFTFDVSETFFFFQPEVVPTVAAQMVARMAKGRMMIVLGGSMCCAKYIRLCCGEEGSGLRLCVGYAELLKLGKLSSLFRRSQLWFPWFFTAAAETFWKAVFDSSG